MKSAAEAPGQVGSEKFRLSEYIQPFEDKVGVIKRDKATIDQEIFHTNFKKSRGQWNPVVYPRLWPKSDLWDVEKHQTGECNRDFMIFWKLSRKHKKTLVGFQNS